MHAFVSLLRLHVPLTILFVISSLTGRAVGQGDVQRRSPRPRHDLAASLAEWSVQKIDLPEETANSFAATVRLGGEEHALVLERYSLRDERFKLLVQDETGRLVETPPSPPRTYRGEVQGRPGSAVTATMTAKGLKAFVDLGNGEEKWYLQPRNDSPVSDGGSAEHLIYKTQDVVPRANFCGVAGPPRPLNAPEGQTPLRAGPTIQEVDIAIDTDYELYVWNNSTIENTVIDVESIINAVDYLYRNQLDICYNVTTIVVRPNGDPYQPISADPGLDLFLDDVQAEWNTNHTAVPRDILHLFSGQTQVGVIGIAWLGAICDSGPTSQGYGLSLTHSEFLYANRVGLTAHELGHNWNACHCNDPSDCTVDSQCGVMCDVIGNCNGSPIVFSGTSVAAITAFRNAATCLVDCTTPGFTGGGQPADYGDAPVGDNGQGIMAYPGVPGRFVSYFNHKTAVPATTQHNYGTWLHANSFYDIQEHSFSGHTLTDVPSFLTFQLGEIQPTTSYDSVQDPDAPENDTYPLILLEALGPNPLATVVLYAGAQPHHNPNQELYINMFIDQNRDGLWRDGTYCSSSPPSCTQVFAWNMEWIIHDLPVMLTPGQLSEIVVSYIRLEDPTADVWVRALISDRPVGAMFKAGEPFWDGTMPGTHNAHGEVEDFLLRYYDDPRQIPLATGGRRTRGGIVLANKFRKTPPPRLAKPSCFLRLRKVDFNRPLFENRPFVLIADWCPGDGNGTDFGMEYKKMDINGGCAMTNALLGLYGPKYIEGVMMPPQLNRLPGNAFINAAANMTCGNGQVLNLPANHPDGFGYPLWDSGEIPVPAITNGPGFTRNWNICYPKGRRGRWRLYAMKDLVKTCGSEVQHYNVTPPPENPTDLATYVQSAIYVPGESQETDVGKGDLIENFIDPYDPPGRPFPDPDFTNYSITRLDPQFPEFWMLDNFEWVTEDHSLFMANAVYSVEPDVPELMRGEELTFWYKEAAVEAAVSFTNHPNITVPLGFAPNWTFVSIPAPADADFQRFTMSCQECWLDEVKVVLGPKPEDADCNANGEQDTTEIANGTAGDCDGNNVPDGCDEDCNNDGMNDGCQSLADCDADGTPDECDPDDNGNGVSDVCDVINGTSPDCNHNLVPDELDPDCDGDGVPDACTAHQDCNINGIPDDCDIVASIRTSTYIATLSPPMTIPNTPTFGTYDITVPDSGAILDVNAGVNITHTWNGDVVCQITHGGQTATLINRVGQSGGVGFGFGDQGFDVVLDDAAMTNIHTASAGGGLLTGVYQPDNYTQGPVSPSPLSVFNGLDMSGTWTIRCSDYFEPSDIGMLNAVSLEITADQPSVSQDCNNNAVPDECDISSQTSADVNGNGIPDECEVVCTAPALVEARSVATHKTGPATTAEFYINLDTTNNPAARSVEPRDSGLRILDFVFDRAITSGSVSVNGGGANAMTLLDGGTRGRITLASPLPNAAVYTLSIDASSGHGCDLSQDICAVALAGDFNGDGAVTAGDKGTLLGFFNQVITQINARYDIQVNGGNSGRIDVGDIGAWTGFFGTNVQGVACP